MITSIPVNSLQWKIAMDNANRAQDFIPLYIKNNKDVLKVLSEIKNAKQRK